MLKPRGASVERLATSGEEDGPVLDLELESQLASVAPLAARASDKTHEMLLSGDMVGYRWGLGLDAPILADLGDRGTSSWVASRRQEPDLSHVTIKTERAP